MNRRLDWVDYAKGIAIILVVFAHNLGGQIQAGLGLPPLLSGIIPYAYSFHMPLFFFLSGLFAVHSYRKGFKAFVKSKVATIFYPFVIWSLIQGTLVSGMGSYVNHQISFLKRLPYLLVTPVGDMWFLEALFAMFLLFALLCRFGLPPAALLVIAVAATIASPWVHPVIVNKICLNLVFFAPTVCFYRPVNKWLLSARPPWLLAVFLLAASLQLVAVFGPFTQDWNTGIRVSAAFLGIASAASLSELLVRGEQVPWIKMEWLKVIGQYSMPIFLMHTIFGAGMRIVLTKFLMLYDPWLHAITELVMGIVLPMGVAYVLTALNAPWAFEWPVRRPAKVSV